jgi:hypothetical protein
MADMNADKESRPSAAFAHGKKLPASWDICSRPAPLRKTPAHARRTCVDVVARADPNEQESVGLLPAFETGPIGSLPIYRRFVPDRPKTRR